MTLWLAGLAAAPAAIAITCVDTQLRTAAELAGVTPTAMTACGLTPADVGRYFDNVRASPELASLVSAGASLNLAEQALQAVLRTNDPLDEGGAAAISAAHAVLADARVQLAAAAAVFVARAEHDLDGPTRQRLLHWRSSPASLPAALRVVSWTPAEVKPLLAALLQERIAAASQSALNAEAAALLAQVRARPEIVDATVRLQTDLPAVKAAFVQALE